MTDWQLRGLETAHFFSRWSKYSTQVGAVAFGRDRQVVGQGFNGLPRGVEDRPERLERPEIYLWGAHAEANLIAHAARAVLAGSDLFVTHCPCAQCAAQIINAGVRSVTYDLAGRTAMPSRTFEVAEQMFHEAGVMFHARER